MFTRLTTTTWSTKVVFVVLAGLMLLTPALVAEAQDTLDPNSPAQNPPGGGNVTNTNNPSNPNAPGFFGDFSPVNEVINGTTGEVIEFQQSVTATDADGNVTTFTTDSASQNAREAASWRGLSDPAPPAEKPPATDSFVESGLKAILYSIVVNLFGTLTGWAGILLDFGINNFVIGFGTAFNSQGVGQAVNELWSLVRDFFNILFIFGFIWIGFQMILDSGNSRAKQTLVSLIMAALLVNFSLFISKFVVDFSNRLASEIAQEAFPIREGEESVLGGDITKGEVAVANTFFAHMGIPRTLDVSFGVRNNENAAWSYIFGSAIFYLVAAFVFAAGGIMLIIRFVALSIFMVLSPFMFLGWVFPGMQGWTGKYWKGFLGRAFYAPVYIVLLFFAGTILQNFFGDRGSMVNNFQLSADGMTTGSLGDILPAFILSCAFLIAAVQVAGKMSADGAGGVMKVGNSLQKGGRRFAARNTAGLVTSYGVNRVGQGGREALRRRNVRLSQSDSKFDRWRARTSERTTGAALDRVATATVAGSETRAARLTRVNAEQATLNTTSTEFKRAEDLAKARTDLSTAGKMPGTTDAEKAARKAAKKDAKNKVKKLTGKMSITELQKLDPDELQSLMKAGLVNRTKMKEIAGTGQFSNAQMKDIGSKRDDAVFKDIEDTFAKSNASATELTAAIEELSKEIESMSDEEKSNIDFNRLNSQGIASQLSEKSMDAIKDSGNLTSSEFDELKKTRTAGVQSILSNGRIAAETRDSEGKVTSASAATVTGPDAADFITKQRNKLIKGNAETIGKLPYDAFYNVTTGTLTDAGKNMTVDAMKAIARVANQGKGTMSADERSNLAKELMTGAIDPKMASYLDTKKVQEDFLLK